MAGSHRVDDARSSFAVVGMGGRRADVVGTAVALATIGALVVGVFAGVVVLADALAGVVTRTDVHTDAVRDFFMWNPA